MLSARAASGWAGRRSSASRRPGRGKPSPGNFIVSCERGPAHSSGIEKCAQAKNVFIFDLNIVEVLLKKPCQEWQDSHPKAITGGGGSRRWVSVPRFHMCLHPGMLVPPHWAGVWHRDSRPARGCGMG